MSEIKPVLDLLFEALQTLVDEGEQSASPAVQAVLRAATEQVQKTDERANDETPAWEILED